eukprot:GHVS01070306.1.p1 GENE.GHVS01070306.1~~GHVS01070306.1.p1  ORF type:complete len:298 (+),score=29.77 GHVS01070306.1:162-1055(+)
MMAKIREPRSVLTPRIEENLNADLKEAMHKIRDMERADNFRVSNTTGDGGESVTDLDPQTSKVVFAKHVSHQGGVLVELTDVMLPGLDLATYLNQVGAMNGGDSLQDAAWITGELIEAIMRLGELRYILSVARRRCHSAILGKETIASALWSEDRNDYHPPEYFAKKQGGGGGIQHCGTAASASSPSLVSKAHTWMIGQVVYRMTCAPDTRETVEEPRLDLCVDENQRDFLKVCLVQVADRLELRELKKHIFLHKHCGRMPTLIDQNAGTDFKAVKAVRNYPYLPQVRDDPRPTFYG